METMLGAWLVNNGVSVVIVILLFLLWLSLRKKIGALGELADKKEEILSECPENRKEIDRQLKSVREAVTLLADKKMDAGKAYEEFVKHDHLSVMSEKTEQTLEAIRGELANIRSDLRMIFEKVLTK